MFSPYATSQCLGDMSYLPVDPQGRGAGSLETIFSAMSSALYIHKLHFPKPLLNLTYCRRSSDLSSIWCGKSVYYKPPVSTKVDFLKLKSHIAAHDRFSPFRPLAVLQCHRTRQRVLTDVAGYPLL